ncbi:MAG TPA: hypothetical protein VMI54_20510 [Polyangiaceae bacterium]|nr:hypothetical protein [Polyangiaceae bacterium]
MGKWRSATSTPAATERLQTSPKLSRAVQLFDALDFLAVRADVESFQIGGNALVVSLLTGHDEPFMRLLEVAREHDRCP